MSEALCKQLSVLMFSEDGPLLKTVSRKPVTILSHFVLKVNLNGIVKLFDFLVFPQCSHQMILTWNFFRAIDIIIDCENEKFQLSEIFPDAVVSKSDIPLLAATDYVIETNLGEKICAVSIKVHETDNAMTIDNKTLM